MQNSKKTILLTTSVVAVLLCGLVGYTVRARVDMGSVAPPVPSPGLLASNDDSVNQIDESQYFYEVSELLRQQYVDPIQVDSKMAAGAVRGMVNSLVDPDSVFMKADQFSAFREAQSGKFQGVGVELRYSFNQEALKKVIDGDTTGDSLMLLPEIVVSSVVPGSSADKAGIKPGDRIVSVDGKAVVTYQDIKAVRDLQTKVTDGTADKDELAKLRDDLTKKVKNNIPTNKARENLVLGQKGKVKVGWTHDGKPSDATLEKAVIEVPTVQKEADGSYAVRFFTNVADKLKAENLRDGTVLDLRNCPQGTPEAALAALSAVAPATDYGYIKADGATKKHDVKTTEGIENPVHLVLLVDSSTSGAAKIFAEALSSKGYATLRGDMTPDPPKWIVTESLEDGSGYTLKSGLFETTPATSVAGASSQK